MGGSGFQVDSTQPITVTTQFITDDNTDSGKLVEVKQFYTQNGKTIEHPSYTVNGNKHDSLTQEFCEDWVATTKDGTNFIQKGGFNGIDKALEKGVVLVMSPSQVPSEALAPSPPEFLRMSSRRRQTRR